MIKNQTLRVLIKLVFCDGIFPNVLKYTFYKIPLLDLSPREKNSVDLLNNITNEM